MTHAAKKAPEESGRGKDLTRADRFASADETAFTDSAEVGDACANFFDFNTRKQDRACVEFPAIIIAEDHGDTPGRICDLSSDGLRLRFSSKQDVADLILIDSPAFSGVVVAEVKWRQGVEVGVRIDRLWTEKLAASVREDERQR
ncbi:MAG: PilZ domain-containing protein [Pseudomonadota bacterium]